VQEKLKIKLCDNCDCAVAPWYTKFFSIFCYIQKSKNLFLGGGSTAIKNDFQGQLN
jgi:hypothetical protein